MGSKELARIRESVVAQVKAGTMTAKDAYPALRGGAYKRGEFENLENQAKAAGKGQWASLSTSAKNAAAAAPVIAPPSKTPAKSDQRAKALGLDPREYAADRNTTAASLTNTLSKSDQRADALGVDRREYAANPDKYNNASTNALATSKPTGYALQGSGGSSSYNKELKALEDERDALTVTANKYGGDVMRESEPKIAMLTDKINKIRQGKDYDGSPATRAAELKELEQNYEQFWNTPAGPGQLDSINKLRGQLGMPTRQQEEAARSATDKARLAGLEATYAATKGSPIAAAQLPEINALRQKMGMPAFTEQKTNDNWFDQLWDSADGDRYDSTGIDGTKRDDLLGNVVHQADRLRNFVSPVIDPVINSDPTGTLAIAASTGGGVGTSAGAYPGAFSNPGRPMSDPNKVTVDSAGFNPSGPVGEFQQTQQVNNPAPNPTMNGTPVSNGSQGTLTGGGVDQVNVGNSGTGTTTNQQMTPTTGKEIYPTPDGKPPTGQTVATTPGTGGNPNPPPTGNDSSPLGNGGTATNDTGWKIDPVTGLLVATGLGGTVGSVLTGNAMADAQIRAAEIQADAANKAADLQKTMYDQTRTDLTPWRSAGEEALGYDRDVQGNLVERASGGLRTFEQDNPQFKSDPFKFDTNSRSPAYNDAYNFRLSEGLKALQSSAAAKGMLRSGNTMQAITQYGQGMASQEVDNEFNRYQTNRTNDFNIFNAQRGSKLNALQSLAGVGQSAVSQMTNAGQNYANNAGQAGMTAANAQANGITGAANDRASGWMGGIQTGMNALGMALDYGNQQTMSNAFAKYYGG